MRPALKIAVLTLTLRGVCCLAQDDPLCRFARQPMRTGANPPGHTASEIYMKLSEVAPFNPGSYHLHDANKADLSDQGAVAVMCNVTERWVFYDPSFVDQIQVNGQSDWPKFFLFAHEFGHHLNGDPLDHHLDQELQADRVAAHWLTHLGASVQDLVDSINAIVVNEDPAPGYPSRCERVRGVIVSYDKEASSLNDLRLGTNKPLYDVGECMPIAQGGGLYAARALEAGTSLHAGDVLSYGSPPADAYLPLSFQRDVDGMCALTRLRKGDRLTWDNLGVCALMSGH